MDYYRNAKDNEEIARIAYDNGKYQVSIALICLSIELYLKSRLNLVEYPLDLDISHDILGIYKCIAKRYKYKKNLTASMTFSRKYYTEARYPFSDSSEVYTKEFCEEFLSRLDDVKDYVDNYCIPDLKDLQNKFNK